MMPSGRVAWARCTWNVCMAENAIASKKVSLRIPVLFPAHIPEQYNWTWRVQRAFSGCIYGQCLGYTQHTTEQWCVPEHQMLLVKIQEMQQWQRNYAILWLRNNGYKEKSRSRVNKVNVERHLLQEEPPLCSALHRANYNISAWRQGPNGSMRPSPINIQLGCMCLLKKILGNPGLSMKWITNKHRQKERR